MYNVYDNVADQLYFAGSSSELRLAVLELGKLVL